MYLVRTWVDPMSNDECPVLLFTHPPSREDVWEELTKENFYLQNKEDAPNESDWDWGYTVEYARLILN